MNGASKFQNNVKGSAMFSWLALSIIAVAGAVCPVTPPSNTIATPILFVTVPPVARDVFASRLSTFANHLPSMESAPRGGDLFIRYPDGSLRNLTAEAGFNNVAVREPGVHWDGNKALFSMVTTDNGTWQIYEASGLGKGETVAIRKVGGQPAGFNNVSPIYTADDKILFSSDRPRNGALSLYPQLDEYESTPTITGLYRLDEAAGSFRILNHTPSGLFSPSIDSFGRVVFVRWDHLQRDQQFDGDPAASTTFASEDATTLVANVETFPEARLGMDSPYGPVGGLRYNLFSPWVMNPDGTEELSMNHIGRHEMILGFVPRSFTDDPALIEQNVNTFAANKQYIRGDAGLFQIKEDPRAAGTFYATYASEFGSMGASHLFRFNGAPGLNAEAMVFTPVTPGNGGGTNPAGRFRDPLPLSNGAMAGVHSTSANMTSIQFRLKQLVRGATGDVTVGDMLTPGITKAGTLQWELEPIEVAPRTRPAGRMIAGLDQAARQVLIEEGVAESELTQWLTSNQLAMIVTNNQTSRDRADKQQPFNLEVPGGVKTVGNTGRVYSISHYQIVQADQVRGYTIRPGRRPIARPMPRGKNPPNAGGPEGSVKIANDGSTAAFVPANRALAWQTTDAAGTPIVRERVWVTLQPGEARTCAGCHGENTRNQAGLPSPTNKPEALRELLRYWKLNK
jgi:hypothetical protein